jgi:hypothetical protein
MLGVINVERFRITVMLVGLLLLAACSRTEEMQTGYAQRCLGCHGTSGRGDGPIAASLPVPVPDFRDTVENKRVYQIRKIIKEGKGVMPAFGPALEKVEIQDMVRFVRILSQQGRELDWWEHFEPLVWAHCSVPWEFVLGYDEPPGGKKP